MMNKDTHLVTAIITTHNRLNLLKRAIKSVEDQTYPYIELIIVDDCSTDGTKEWCNQMCFKQFPKIQSIQYIHISESESHGGNYARNLGIKNSHGEYIAFLDDDDVWLPNKIELQVSLIRQKNCGVVYGPRIIEEIQKDSSINYIKCKINPIYQGDVSKLILTKIFTTTSLILIRKNLLEQVGLFDENLKFWQEYELMIRLAQITDFYSVTEPIIYYRIDTADSYRLTNKYHGWRNAVKYVHHKHAKLYRSLNSNQRLESRALVWEDASNRCKNSEFPLRHLWYRGLYNMWRTYRFFKIRFNKKY